MSCYRLAGQVFYFTYTIPELKPFEKNDGMASSEVRLVPGSFGETALISHTEGWVGGDNRFVEVYYTSSGMLLKVGGGNEFFIAPHGETISRANPQAELTKFDREIILGPALVLALALRGIWGLHASAAMYKENVIVFLGESGQGKSSLAIYLSQSEGWCLVADDIMPVKIDTNGVSVLPRFPQLKLSMDAQPGPKLPENLPLSRICLLTFTDKENNPELQLLSRNQAVQVWLSHTAGTRLFNPVLLAKHLDFCTQAAGQHPVYRLTYPHRRDALPVVKDLLESIC